MILAEKSLGFIHGTRKSTIYCDFHAQAGENEILRVGVGNLGGAVTASATAGDGNSREIEGGAGFIGRRRIISMQVRRGRPGIG